MSDPLPVPPLKFPASSLPRKIGGYDRQATERLFDKLHTSYEQLWLECENLREQMRTLESQAPKVEEERRLLANALIDASQSAASVVEDARREAEAALRKARKRAGAMLAQAEDEAKEAAARIVLDAETERARLETELAELQALAGKTRHEVATYVRWALERTEMTNGDQQAAAAAEGLAAQSGHSAADA